MFYSRLIAIIHIFEAANAVKSLYSFEACEYWFHHLQDIWFNASRVCTDAKLSMKITASDSGRGPGGMVWQDTANTKMSCTCPWMWRLKKAQE